MSPFGREGATEEGSSAYLPMFSFGSCSYGLNRGVEEMVESKTENGQRAEENRKEEEREGRKAGNIDDMETRF